MDRLIVEKKPRSPISEAYRTVRTNIEFSSIDSEVRKVLITSSGPGEGKSTTAANLAVAFAQSGKRTLLIDGDLRQPSVFKLFNLSNRMGLSNVIVDGVNILNPSTAQIDGLGLDEVIHHYSEKLDILTSGTIPPNPSEIVGSNKMRIFIESMAKRYDRIIIDAPPVNAVTDAQLLSTMVDGVLFVVGSEITHIGGAKRAIELLNHVNAKILGVVMTHMKMDKNKYGYNGYNYYASDGQKPEKNKKRRKK